MENINLSQIPLFSGLPPGELDSLEEALQPAALDPGAVLFREGEPGDKFFIIIGGEVEIVKALDTPDEQILDTRGEGDFFGEMSLLIPDGRRTASVRARSRVHLMELSRAEFERLMEQRPSLALKMVRELSKRLRHSDNAMIRDLTEKNRELSRAYRELKEAQAQLVEKERLETEMDLARNIQQRILPDDLALLEGFDFGARMLPARAVGGDLYDLFRLDEDTVGVSIGDVSDKGVPAALVMAEYCSLLRAEAPHAFSPASALRNVNRHLLDFNQGRMFVTALYGILDRRTGEFSYARAGHHAPLLFDRSGEEMSLSTGHGQLLGFFSDPALDVGSVNIPPGSTLLLYTDGMFDIMDDSDQKLGEKRLRDMARAFGDCSADELCENILGEIKTYQGETTQFDDMTLVAMRRPGGSTS